MCNYARVLSQTQAYGISLVELVNSTQIPIINCFHRAKNKVPFSMAIGNGKLCMSVFPNTRTWEQQERNKIKKQTKQVR